MNDQINVLLELLEEIKQQNRDLKTTITNLEGTPKTVSTEKLEVGLHDLTKTAELLLEDNFKWKKELREVGIVLGKRIAEIKMGLLDSTKTSNDVVAKIDEIQTKETTPAVKKFYLLDAKRWIQWAIWGVMILFTSASIGWATYQIQRNRTLHDYALRYRILRMEQSVSSNTFAKLDSIFDTHRSESEIAALQQRVITYENAIQRQAELRHRQQELSAEQEEVQQQLNQ